MNILQHLPIEYEILFYTLGMIPIAMIILAVSIFIFHVVKGFIK